MFAAAIFDAAVLPALVFGNCSMTSSSAAANAA